MLIEVDANTYKDFFPTDPHPFISKAFIELNKEKPDVVVRLIGNSDKPDMGLVAGIRNKVIQSPFSAPFGGFHFRKENMYIGETDSFLAQLKEYVVSNGLKGIEVTLPPNIYNTSINAKVVNSFVRNGYDMQIPEITNWVNLQEFTGRFSQKNSREYYKQALKNGLAFELVTISSEKDSIYQLIASNRKKFGRPIFMSFADVLDTSELWPVDFFKVSTSDETMVASAIIYRSHAEICYALFWGDNETGRPLRAMDFLSFNLWSYYKKEGFKYMDLGVSTETGIPNEGLLRFKESHEAKSSLKFRFVWYQ